jgi:hypothetical protein
MRSLLILAIALPLMSQPYRRHNLTLGLGAGLPRADLQSFLHDSFGLGVGYGYRFHRNFQADIGLDTLFHAARIRDFYQSDFGDLRIRDYQFLVPFGARAIWPLAHDRLQIHGGGGGAYIRYTEKIRQPFGGSYFRLDCPVCESRSGWGYYSLAGFSVALDRYQHFRFGVIGKVYRGNTNGDPFGSLPPVQTSDTWVNVFAGLGFSF